MMKYNSDIHHRRSIRLKGYDYSYPGYYFITICVQHREPYLGKIRNGEVVLSQAGEMARKWWCLLNQKFKNIEIDEFIIMPNHIHGIIQIHPPVGADLCVRPGYDG